MEIRDNILVSVLPSDIKNGTFIFPSEIKGISTLAFSNCTNLEYLEIPNNIIYIGSNAFSNCTGLKKITLPNKLQSMSANMFERCTSLESVEMPDTVFMMDANVFSYCTSLKEVKLSEKLKSIPPFTFSDCQSLESITIPSSVSIIDINAFMNCSSLKSIKIPENLAKINSHAFYKCTALESINLPSFMQEIQSAAFKDCTSLKSINLPKDLPKISISLFENCTSLEYVSPIKNVLSIEDCAFKNCSALKELQLSNNIHIIRDFAFEKCSSLKSINIPTGITKISASTFADCSSLENITIPNNILQINSSAFYNCDSLKSLNIPSSVKIIGKNAFADCDSLEYISIPNSVELFNEITNDSLLFFTKNEDGFILSNNQSLNSIPTENLKIDLSLLSHQWDKKQILLKEQNNPKVLDFYNNFITSLPNDKIAQFLDNHNFTFFKQLDLEKGNPENYFVYNFLYNIGAFEPPIEENGKKIDYAQKTIGFILEKLNKNQEENIYTFIQPFYKMEHQGFKKEFTDFFMKNYDELIAENKLQPDFISNCYNTFEEVQKTNTNHHGEQRRLKPTIEKFKFYFAKDKFKGVTDENNLIAQTISPYFNEQKDFDNAISIENERIKKKTPANILKKPVNEKNVFAGIDELSSKINDSQAKTLGNLAQTATNEFSFEWLSKNDPQNYILGKFCSCCAHLKGVGYGIMKASIVHPYVQNLVIHDKNGTIIAKSTLFINHKKRYGVCNNVEVSNDVNAIDYKQIYDKFVLGIKMFAEQYNKEHPFRKLKQINVGMHLNDIFNDIKNNNPQSPKILKALDYSKFGIVGQKYSGDSDYIQYIIWTNSPVSQEKEKQ